MAIASTMIWEIRSSATAGNVNSGGFNPSGGGVDYTLQDAAQYAYTDLASTNGTNSTPTVTSATHTFVAADVGNTIRISAGVNWTTGVFEITSVSGGGAILDRACGSAASISSGTWKEGGAFSLGSAAGVTDDAVFELGVAGNKFYVKAGTYTLGGTVSTSAAGGAQNPIIIEGYNATRGDFPLATDRPLFDCGAVIFTSGSNWDIKHMRFTGTGTNVLAPGSSGRIRYSKISNTSGTSGRSAMTGTLNSFFYGVEANSTNGQAITSSSNFVAEYCYFNASDIGVNITGTATSNILLGCIFKGNATAAIKATGAFTGQLIIDSCTIYGSETPAGIGLSLATGTTNVRLTNSIVYGFVTGVSHADVQTIGYENHCAFFNNTTNRTNWVVGTSSIALNPTFTNAASGDFSVGTNMRAVGYPGLFPGGLSTGYTDIGAIQRKELLSTDPGIANVRLSTNYTLNDLSLTGTLNLPNINDVRLAITFDNATKTGTARIPAVANVKTGYAYDSSDSLTGIYTGSDRWSDPLLANVKTGISYLADAATQTGSYIAAERYSDPGIANVRLATSYLFNASTLTGTLPIGATYSDPGIANVRLATNYIYSDITLTGTLIVPGTLVNSTATAGLNDIKENIQTMLFAANTTTGTPIDLSYGLSNSKRVKQILKTHPEMIKPQASFFPLVTCYISEKEIVRMDIAKTQLSSRRRATVKVKIVGSIWNTNMSTIDEDPADEDINQLMENIELILRGDHTLGRVVNWQLAQGCRYFTSVLDEQTHLRSGILDLDCEVFNKETTQMEDKQIRQQSNAAYNQWAVQWRKHSAEHSKYKKKPMSDFENVGVGKAIVCVANGYSFEEQIETLKTNQHNVDILCCDKTLGSLLDHGIIPTYCMVCDANVDYEKYLKPYETKLDKIVLFINVCANPEWSKNGNWKDRYFFVNEDIIDSHLEFSKLSGSNNLMPAGTNVSNAMVILLAQSNNEARRNFFGYDKIILLGFDYSWKSYGKYYAFNETGDGKSQYMKHSYVVTPSGEFGYTSGNLTFSMQWLKKYVDAFNLPVVQAAKDSLLQFGKHVNLETQMKYEFKRSDKVIVQKAVKELREAQVKTIELQNILQAIGRNHWMAHAKTI